tara:strand:- start:493 stop:1062 length:570 start_codon:yes stop_codon:yes gene_type:complete
MYRIVFFRRNFEWFAFSLDSGTSFIGVLMATESKPGDESGLPFEDPLQVPSDQKETIKMASDEPAEISLQSGEDNLGPANQASLDELMAYLQKGLNSLKGLDLNGFQQIYPVFLSIFGAVIAALILVIASNILHSINHLPLIGDLLGGVLELCGLVTVTRFVLSNLLLQKKRADLYVRIALVKKELIGR